MPPVPEDGLQLEELRRENWLVSLPESHPLSGQETIKISALDDENFVTAHPELGPGCHHQTRELFRSAGGEPRIVAQAFRRLTMLMLVRAGAGVTLVPGSFESSALDGVVTRPLAAGERKMRVAIAYGAGDMPGLVAQFLRTVRGIVG